jgi:hypothetical protein
MNSPSKKTTKLCKSIANKNINYALLSKYKVIPPFHSLPTHNPSLTQEKKQVQASTHGFQMFKEKNTRKLTPLNSKK